MRALHPLPSTRSVIVDGRTVWRAGYAVNGWVSAWVWQVLEMLFEVDDRCIGIGEIEWLLTLGDGGVSNASVLGSETTEGRPEAQPREGHATGEMGRSIKEIEKHGAEGGIRSKLLSRGSRAAST